MSSDLEEKLKSEIHQVEWDALTPHVQRGRVITISQELDLLEVALKVAHDDSKSIQNWLDEGKVIPLSEELSQKWSETPKKPFQFIILQPYVLIQESAH
jgi:hypothetical protein